MQTPIGRRLRDSRSLLYAAVAVAVAAVLADLALLALVRWGPPHSWSSGAARGAVALTALWVCLMLVGGDPSSMGLVARPIQGWVYWAKMTLVIGLLVALIVLIGFGIWHAMGRELTIYTTSPRYVGAVLFSACFVYPVLEEALYRMVLCLPAAVLLRPWGAIAVSGLLFAALHFVYGNPSPENLVGGFFLAWAYLKSGTILVPVLLHSLGNLCAVAGQVAGWYWLGGVM